MTLETISERTGRSYRFDIRALGKVLHVARQQGWHPKRVSHEWPSDSWETEIILPHLGRYMPGRFSRGDAEDLRVALTRAFATGAVAAERLDLAAATLLEVAKSGPFQVRMADSAGEESGVGTHQQAFASK